MYSGVTIRCSTTIFFASLDLFFAQAHDLRGRAGRGHWIGYKDGIVMGPNGTAEIHPSDLAVGSVTRL